MEITQITSETFSSISSDILEAALPTIIAPPDLNLTHTIINDRCQEPFTSNHDQNNDQAHNANVLKILDLLLQTLIFKA